MKNNVTIIVSAFVLLVVIALFSLSIGSVETSISDVFKAFFNYDTEDLSAYTIVNLRLPRILMAFTVGASLALAGYLMQLLIGNPLADPFILGTSSAASLGANLMLFITGASVLGIYFQVVGAFIIAVISTFVVILIAMESGKIYTSKLLLAGIAMSSLMTSCVSILTFYAQSDKMRAIIFWIMGSLEGANFEQVSLLFVLLGLSLVILLFTSKEINMLVLGVSKAKYLGFNAKKMSVLIICISVLLTATSVSFVGPVGFVGLIIPHFIRNVFGSINRMNLVWVSVLGGIFLVFADFISKLIYLPVGIPIGIVCSLFGVPFFVYLLRKKNFRFE